MSRQPNTSTTTETAPATSAAASDVDLEHGACNLFIVERLGVSQPAGSRHLKVLVDAGLIIATRRRGWTYYRRNEAQIAAVVAKMAQI